MFRGISKHMLCDHTVYFETIFYSFDAYIWEPGQFLVLTSRDLETNFFLLYNTCLEENNFKISLLILKVTKNNHPT